MRINPLWQNFSRSFNKTKESNKYTEIMTKYIEILFVVHFYFYFKKMIIHSFGNRAKIMHGIVKHGQSLLQQNTASSNKYEWIFFLGICSSANMHRSFLAVWIKVENGCVNLILVRRFSFSLPFSFIHRNFCPGVKLTTTLVQVRKGVNSCKNSVPLLPTCIRPSFCCLLYANQ